MTAFQPPLPAGAAAAPVAVNVIDTGDIEAVRDDILQRAGAIAQQKITAFLDCLSQTHRVSGRYQGKCESVLKNALFAYAKDHPHEAQRVLRNPHFQEDAKLTETLKKVNYLTAGLFGFRNKKCNYIRRVVHHIHESYIVNRHSGLTLSLTGAGFLLVGGLQTALTSDANSSDNLKKRNEAWAVTAIGASAILLPFFNAFRLAAKDDI